MLDITQRLTARAAPALLLAVFLAPVAAVVAARGDAQELTILRYEPLAGLVVTESTNSADGATPGTRMSFSAFGTQFAMLLRNNEALTRNLPPEVLNRLAATTFYTGTLEGNPESWGRITRTGDALSGAIWDGTELYAIESFARVAAHVVAGPVVLPAEAIIYRWSDTLSAVADTLGPPAASGSNGSQKVVAAEMFDAFAGALLKLTPAQQIDIGLLADSEFVQTHGANSEARMLSVANIVDGIFLGQVGVRINVAELHTYAEPDAFSGTDVSALLDQLQGFKYDTQALRGRGLVHLLTGRDLDERPGTPAGSRLLGVANVGAICDERFAVSLTQFTDLNTAAVVAAHEIGHNFGAPHDTESGSPCQSTPDGFIMNPFVNGSRQFSQCSVQQMEAELAAAACLTDLPGNDLSVLPLSPPAQAVATREFDIEFAVDYGGAGDAAQPALTITTTNVRIWSISTGGRASCSDNNSAPIADSASTCTFSGLPAAGGRVTFDVRLFEPQVGPTSIEIEVTSLNDNEPANNRHRFELDVVPDARFVLTSSDAPVAVKPREVFDVDWVVVNQGSIPATGIRAEFRLSGELDFIEAQTPSGAACVRGPLFDEQWLCPVGTMAPGETVTLKLTVLSNPARVPSPGSTNGANTWLKMVAAEPIFDWRNEWQEGVSITPVIVDVHVVDFTAPASATVGSDVTITLRVGNRGPDDAPNVSALLQTWTGDGLTFNSASSSRGSCSKELSGTMRCPFGVLASGETIEVVAQATVDMQVRDIDLVGSAGTPGSFDSDRTNNERMMLFRAVAAAPPPAPPAPSPPPPSPAPPSAASGGGGGGGGGGGIDLALLLLLVGCAVCRWSARRR